MLKNYIKITLRTLHKNKVYSLINLFGLITGLTCALLIIIYVTFELSYDQYHSKANQIYRLGRESTVSGTAERQPLSCAPASLALLNEFPEVVNCARIGMKGEKIVRYEENKFYEKNISYVDKSVFQLFNFPMIKGNPDEALTNPYSVVLTEETAEKYFGASNPMGKMLKFNDSENYIVTGIIQNLPDNTHFQFDMLCSFETLYAENLNDLESWIDFNYFTYLELKKDYDPTQLENKFPAFIKKYSGENYKVQGEAISYFLHPLTKIHLYSHLEGFPPGKITAVYTYSILAFFLILIACINFMNLSTARSVTRAKEVGIRKVVGASKLNLIYQFLTEAIVLSILALAISLLLIDLVLPWFSNLVGQKLTFDVFEKPNLLIGFIALAVLIGIVAGSYPAFYLSRYLPIKVLKSQIIGGNKKSRIRNAFVVIQFFFSTIFILQTFILSKQIDYLKNKDLGLNKDNILLISLPDQEDYNHLKTVKNEFEKVYGVEGVTLSSVVPGGHIPKDLYIPEDKSSSEMIWLEKCNVDDNFFSMMEIEIKEGRSFSENFILDSENSIIINETASSLLGWEEPIGKSIKYKISEGQYKEAVICGVVKDFHLASLYQKIGPLVISNLHNNLNHILVRLNSDAIDKSIMALDKKWNLLYPSQPFNYSFLDKSYGHYYTVLNRVLAIMSSFSILAIIIACLGTFALVLYLAENKRKELGIRKVMGASVFKLVYDLNKKTLRLILGAIILACIVMNLPLSGDSNPFFPYMGKIPITLFFKAGLMLFLIAILTVVYQSVKSALINPVESLRNE